VDDVSENEWKISRDLAFGEDGFDEEIGEHSVDCCLLDEVSK
jgi:hypothetical protein